ncbi:MAG: response regulator [Methylococcaceae bacterium]
MANIDMRSNNWQQEHQHALKREPLRVMPLGFNVMLEEKLKALFKLERQNDRVYTLAHQGVDIRIDILLVNYDNPSALQKKDLILGSSYPNAQVVAVSQGPLRNPPDHHLRGMITVARLLSILDKIQFLAPTPALISVSERSSTTKPANNLNVTQDLVKSESQSTSIEQSQVINNRAEKKTDGYRALVVDDSAAIQKSIEVKLAALPQIATIDFADSGESALEKAEANHYDLIFLDVMMPGIDGYETCTQLRKKPEYKKTPIIMVSGKTSPLDEVKGVMAGCTTYITKPVKDEAFNKLSLRVLSWLADRKVKESNAVGNA